MTYWDRFGSDVDHHEWLNGWSHDDAREDWCEEHQQRQTTCGPCHTAGALNEDGELVRELDGDAMVAAVVAAMAKVSARIR